MVASVEVPVDIFPVSSSSTSFSSFILNDISDKKKIHLKFYYYNRLIKKYY